VDATIEIPDPQNDKRKIIFFMNDRGILITVQELINGVSWFTVGEHIELTSNQLSKLLSGELYITLEKKCLDF